ncbi:MAG: hypothetical protein WAP51_04650 [Candidatus Sungiibacteriota bacterium]
MKFLFSNKTVFFFALALVVLPNIILAQGIVPCGTSTTRPCTICDLGVLVINLTNFLIYNIAIPLASLMIIIGGIMIMIGSASEERVKTGKKILTNAIIGVIIVFVAWLLVDTIIKVLTGSFAQNFFGTFGPWNRIPPGACPF